MHAVQTTADLGKQRTAKSPTHLETVAAEDGFHDCSRLVPGEEGQVLLSLVGVAGVGNVVHVKAVTQLLVGFPLLVQTLLVPNCCLWVMRLWADTQCKSYQCLQMKLVQTKVGIYWCSLCHMSSTKQLHMALNSPNDLQVLQSIIPCIGTVDSRMDFALANAK